MRFILNTFSAYCPGSAYITPLKLYLCSLSSYLWPLPLHGTVPMSRLPGAGISASRFQSYGGECTDHTPVVRGSRVSLARSTAPSQWAARDSRGADINPWMCSQSSWPKVCRTDPLNIRFIWSVSLHLLLLWRLCSHMFNATSRLSLSSHSNSLCGRKGLRKRLSVARLLHFSFTVWNWNQISVELNHLSPSGFYLCPGEQKVKFLRIVLSVSNSLFVGFLWWKLLLPPLYYTSAPVGISFNYLFGTLAGPHR